MTTDPKTWEVRVSIVGEGNIFAMVTGTNPKDCFDRAMNIINQSTETSCEDCVNRECSANHPPRKNMPCYEAFK